MTNNSADLSCRSETELTSNCQQGSATGYLALPSILRSRLPTITSLRQSASDVVSRPLASPRTVSASDCTPASNTTNRSRRGSVYSIDVTRSTASSNASSPRLTGSDLDIQAIAIHSTLDLDSTSQHLQAGGVDWLLASAGIRLWLNAQRQAELSTRNPALLRSMHIDALKYMNMALPNNLSTTEIETIQESLPPQILHSSNGNSQELVSAKPNLLRQSVAQAVCWMIALTMLIIPLLMTAVNRVFVYERKHRVTQRVLIRSADLTKALGERGVDFGNALVQFSDTPLGKAGMNFTSWFVEGVVAGVSDGYAMSTKNVRYLE